MKPFNLQEALAGKPVVTRDGRKVQDIRHLPSATMYTVVGVVDGSLENPRTFTHHGAFSANDVENDLFMAPQKKKGWINIYQKEGKTESGYYYGNVMAISSHRVIHSCRESADAGASSPYVQDLGPRIACALIEWEE